jgi:hypothetical protein
MRGFPTRRAWRCGLAALAVVACGSEPEVPLPVRSATLFSEPYPVDQVYRSMTGPDGVQRFAFDKKAPPELLWITGFEAEIVSGEDQHPMSPEFMCHSNLDFLDTSEHSKLVRRQGVKTNRRLFTLSQGQMEVDFPSGFGVPVLSNETFSLTTQVLNLNPQEKPFDVRHKTTIYYVRDAEAPRPMQALYQLPLQSLVLLEGADGFVGMPEGGHPDATSCAVGEPARDRVINDNMGRKFAAHWVVEPGRHVYHTPVTRMMRIPGASTRVHFIAVHLHPFAESLVLRDWTTGETVFKSEARNRDEQIGLSHVESFESVEGLEIHANHGYELIATYDNTSGEPQDSMAVMFLYAADPAFTKPVLVSQKTLP